MSLGTEVGVGPGDTVLDGDPAPHFSAHDHCGQMAGGIKMLLGSWYRGILGPGDIMLDGDPAPSCKGAQQPPPLLAHVYCSQTITRLSNC